MGRGITIFLLLFLVFHPSCFSQQVDYVFKHFTRDDQLASNQVNSILKDHNGFIWFATMNGLQKYDGKRFVTYQHVPNDSSSIRDNNVGYLMEDRNKRLWVWTALGTSVYDPIHDNFSFVEIEFDKKRQDFYYSFGLYEDSQGYKWNMLYPGGLFRYDSISNKFKPYTTFWPKCSANILRIVEDGSSGNFWLTTDAGAMYYDAKSREYYSHENNPHNVAILKDTVTGRSTGLIYRDQNGIMWLAFWDQSHAERYYRYDSRKNHLEEILQNLGAIQLFRTDASSTTWAVGDKLLRYSEKDHLFVEIKKKRNERLGLDFNQMFCMYEDDEHNLWTGTDIGVFVFNPILQKFSTTNAYSFKEKKMSAGDINGFLQLKDGNILAMGWGGDGLYFFDSNMNQIPYQYGYDGKLIKDNNHRLTWCALDDSHGTLWIGCQSGRLMRIDSARKKIEYLNPPEFNDRTVRSVMEDKNQNLWFGTQSNVIVKWERRSGKYIQVMPPPPGKYDLRIILRILPGRHNDIWVSSNSGLLRLKDDDGSVLDYFAADRDNPDSLQSNGLSEILWWGTDTLAIATSVGIEFLDLKSRRISQLFAGTPFFNTRVFSMIRDEDANIWFSTNNGLSKIHVPTRKITSYGYREGITDEYFFPGSVARLKNGKLAFGTIRSIVYFRPEDVREKSVPPDVHITGFQVFGKSLPVDSLLQNGNTVKLDYQQNFITIRFSSMSNTINDRLDYYATMVGLDKDWAQTNALQEAQFTYLPGGRYTFKVYCVSREGVHCKNITTLNIIIIPPFWQRNWFYVFCFLLVAGIIYAIYRIRINRILEIGKMRTRIARDLHDDMGSTLSTINILSEMAKMKVGSDVGKTGEYIEKISDNSTRMMEAMDDIVWSINPSNDSMQKITARMREFANGVLEAREIEFNFQMDEKIMYLKLNPEARRDLFLIFKEAINNLAKYSCCKHTWVSLRLENGWIAMTIQDDGVGFEVANADDGNGLTNMRKRAQSMKGSLEIISRPKHGTKVSLEFQVT